MEFSRPEGAFSADPTLWLYTSLSSGSSTIVTATARMETILKANRVPFKALDVATEEKARMLWGRRAGKRTLPGLVKQGMVLADLVEVEEWNEYGEVRENLLDEDETEASPALASLSKPAAPAAATPPPRPEAPTPAAATGAPGLSPSAAAIKAAGSISSLRSTATTASAQSSKSAESERKENMLSLAEQVAAKAKKASGLRTASGSVLARNKADSSASKSTTSSITAESKEKSEDSKDVKPAAEPAVNSAKEVENSKDTQPEEKVAEKSTERIVPTKEHVDETPEAAKVDSASKSESAAEKVASTDAGEKVPAKTAPVKKEESEDDDESGEDSDEEEEGDEKRKTQEQDPIAIENGMVELEIQMMLNSPTMGSVRERRKRSDAGKHDTQPGSPDTLDSTLEEDDYIPGFHSPKMRSGGASPLSSMSPMSGFGFNNANDDVPENQETSPDITTGFSDQPHDGLGSTRELKNQRSMVPTEGSSNLEKPVVRMPSLPDDEEEVSAGCCGGLFGGGKKKKKKQGTA